MLLGALLLLAVTLCCDFSFLYSAQPIPGEENLRLGQHLRATGILSINDQPACFRPPGFPVFAAVVLWARDHLSPSLSDERAVILTHGILLSLGTVLVFLFAVRRHSAIGAVAFGCVFAFHPALLIIATCVSYPMLNIVLVIAATLALTLALRATHQQAIWALLAGVLWGVTTLVRPLSLILPPFVLLLAHWEYGRSCWPRTLRFSGVFTLGMILAIAPVTWRNYRVSGRLIAINAQAGFSFWGASLEETKSATDYPTWVQLWNEQGVAIFRRVTGLPEYSLDAFYANALPLNDAFAAEARKNIMAHPGTYLRNVSRSFVRYNFDTPRWWFHRYRTITPRQDSSPRSLVDFSVIFSVALAALALLGIVRGIFRGETLARTLLVIYVMFCLGTCIGFPAERYNFVRLPLIILALPLLIPGDNRIMLRWPWSSGSSRPKPFPSLSMESGTLFALILAACAATASLLVL